MNNNNDKQFSKKLMNQSTCIVLAQADKYWKTNQ